MNCTAAASVFVAVAKPGDLRPKESRRFLQEARASQTNLPCPTLVLPECAAALARQTRSTGPAERLVRAIQRLPRVEFVDLDLPLGQRAAEIAASLRLRGADSVYVAVAEARTATLITWDAEMLQRAPAVASTMTPTEWMARQTPNP